MTFINTDGMSFIGPGSEWFWTALSGIVLAVTFLAIYRQLRLQRGATAIEQLDAFQREWRAEPILRAKVGVLAALRDGVDRASVPNEPAETIVMFWDGSGTWSGPGISTPSCSSTAATASRARSGGGCSHRGLERNGPSQGERMDLRELRVGRPNHGRARPGGGPSSRPMTRQTWTGAKHPCPQPGPTRRCSRAPDRHAGVAGSRASADGRGIAGLSAASPRQRSAPDRSAGPAGDRRVRVPITSTATCPLRRCA